MDFVKAIFLLDDDEDGNKTFFAVGYYRPDERGVGNHVVPYFTPEEIERVNFDYDSTSPVIKKTKGGYKFEGEIIHPTVIPRESDDPVTVYECGFGWRWKKVTEDSTMGAKFIPIVELLARSFSKKLREQIPYADMKKVIEWTKENEDGAFCDTHTYCDANMVMLEAFEEVLGITDCFDNAFFELFTPAWNMARKHLFY